MSFFEELKTQTDEMSSKKAEVERNILDSFKEYLKAGRLEGFLEKHIGDYEKQKREYTLATEFWGYHSGCGGTAFRAAGFVWKNPDEDEYSFSSYRYKGIELTMIQNKVVDEMTDLLIEKLKEIGFRISCTDTVRSSLGYRHWEIKISW